MDTQAFDSLLDALPGAELQGLDGAKFSCPVNPAHGKSAFVKLVNGKKAVFGSRCGCSDAAITSALISQHPEIAHSFTNEALNGHSSAHAEDLSHLNNGSNHHKNTDVKSNHVSLEMPPDSELGPEPEYVRSPFRSQVHRKPTPDALSEAEPQNIDVEYALLSSIFIARLEPGVGSQRWALDEISKRITPESFIKPSNQKAYAAMLRLDEQRSPIEWVTLQNELKDAGHWEEVGCDEYLTMLATHEATALNAPHYADIVASKARDRAGLSLSINLQQAFLHHGDTQTLIKRLAELPLNGSASDPYYDRHAIDAYEAYITSRADQRGYSVAGLIRWGTTALLSALIGSGKTTLSLNFARAWGLGEKVLGRTCTKSRTLAVVSPKEYEAWIETVGFWGLQGTIFVVPSYKAHFANPQKTADWFVSEMERCQCRTFVLDTLFDFFGMPPSNGGDQNRIVMTEQTPLLEAVREHLYSGLVTGHAPKSEANNPNPRDPEEAFAGHTAWAAQHRMRITIRRKAKGINAIITGRGGFGDEGILEERLLQFDPETRLDSLGSLFSEHLGETAWPEVQQTLRALGTPTPISKLVVEMGRGEKFIRPGLKEGRRLKLVVMEGKGKATKYRLLGPNEIAPEPESRNSRRWEPSPNQEQPQPHEKDREDDDADQW